MNTSPNPESSAQPVIQIQKMNKWFGQFHVLKEIDLEVGTGERIVICGPSGSGKSTLIRCINRLEEHQEGQIVVDGIELTSDLKHIEQVRREVGMVFQHFSLFDALTVFENIALGLDKTLKRNELKKRTLDVSKEYGLSISLDKIAGNLSAGERQRIEIIRCLLLNPKIMIMDEPTSVLTPGEISDLFSVLKKLSNAGMSILYISHKLEEIRILCTKATIMRRGQVVKNCDPRNISAVSYTHLTLPTKRIV